MRAECTPSSVCLRTLPAAGVRSTTGAPLVPLCIRASVRKAHEQDRLANLDVVKAALQVRRLKRVHQCTRRKQGIRNTDHGNVHLTTGVGTGRPGGDSCDIQRNRHRLEPREVFGVHVHHEFDAVRQVIRGRVMKYMTARDEVKPRVAPKEEPGAGGEHMAPQESRNACRAEQQRFRGLHRVVEITPLETARACGFRNILRE
jgi:hypothetical protein